MIQDAANLLALVEVKLRVAEGDNLVELRDCLRLHFVDDILAGVNNSVRWILLASFHQFSLLHAKGRVLVYEMGA